MWNLEYRHGHSETAIINLTDRYIEGGECPYVRGDGKVGSKDPNVRLVI